MLDHPSLLQGLERPVDGRPRQRPDGADLALGLQLLDQAPAVDRLLGEQRDDRPLTGPSSRSGAPSTALIPGMERAGSVTSETYALDRPLSLPTAVRGRLRAGPCRQRDIEAQGRDRISDDPPDTRLSGRRECGWTARSWEARSQRGRSSFTAKEAIDAYCWRVEQLERAGYSAPIAHELAADHQVDLHGACKLLSHGCPEHTAYAIPDPDAQPRETAAARAWRVFNGLLAAAAGAYAYRPGAHASRASKDA